MSKRSLTILLAIGMVATVYVMWVGSFGSPVITISNEASSSISNIVLSGTGYRTTIFKLEPGKSITVVLHPTGEAGIRVEFLSSGGPKVSEVGYIEPGGGYCEDLTIARDFEVLYKPGRLGCFSWRRIL